MGPDRDKDGQAPIRVTRAMIARCRTLEDLAALFELGGSIPTAALAAAKRTLEAREMREREGRSFLQKYRCARPEGETRCNWILSQSSLAFQTIK